MGGRGFKDPVIVEEDYLLGALRSAPQEVLQPSGQWDEFLPLDELQASKGYETNACVSFGTLNCVETILRKRGIEENFSDRFMAIISDTDPYSGNDPQRVAESLRKIGAIGERNLPFENANTLSEFYSPNPMTQNHLDEAISGFLSRYEFKHEYVFKGGNLKSKQVKLKEALRYSPVGISVNAWIKDGEYYVKGTYDKDNHWVMLYGYLDGEYWKVFDHYDDTTKELAWNYNFGFAKRYHCKIKDFPKRSWWQIILDYLYGRRIIF